MSGEQKAANKGLEMYGYFRTVIEFKEDEIAGEDLDAAAYLFMDLKPLDDDRLSFHFYGRTRADLDGRSVVDDALARTDSMIFQAYADLKRVPEIMDFRLGRQWLHDIEGVYIDGLRALIRIERDFEFLVFGGRPAPIYSSADGQSIFGAQVKCKPFRHTQVRVDAVRSDERNPIVNDHIGLHINQRIGQNARISYDQKLLNNRDKDIRIGGSAFVSIIQTEITANYYERTSTAPKPSRDDVFGRYFSDYYQLFEEIQKLKSYSFNVLRYFGEHVIVAGGASITNILEKGNPFNRDSERYFVSFSFLDVFVNNLNLSLDTNFGNSEFSSATSTIFTDIDGSQNEVISEIRQDDEFFFITGELEYAINERIQVSAGSAYGDYDFDRARQTTQPVSNLVPLSLLVTTGAERFITRTYFTELDWKISKSLRTELFVEYDRSKINSTLDTGSYVRVRASLTYKF